MEDERESVQQNAQQTPQTALDVPTFSPPIPDHLAREAEFKQRLAVEQERRWRSRRITYAAITVLMGLALPVVGVLFAASIASGDVWAWVHNRGWLPTLLTVGLSGIASAVNFYWGWGIIRGMAIFALIFIAVVAITRSVMGELLPAMPGLVSVFIMTGAIVGYLTVLEEGE